MSRIYSLLLISTIALSSCNNSKRVDYYGKEELNTKILENSFSALLEEVNTSGSILLYDPLKETFHCNDFKNALVGTLPASTFKIPNSIILLESREVKDLDEIIK